MKITIATGFFLPVPPVLGGSTEKTWHRLALEFAAAGHEVTFISRRWPGLPECEAGGRVRHLRLRGCDHARSLSRNLWHDFWWGLRVARHLPPADVTVCNAVSLPVWAKRLRPRAGRIAAVIARMPRGQLRFYGRTDRLLALSRAVADRIAADAPALAGRTRLFPYPLDWALLAQHAAKSPPPAPLRIGYIGRIHPEKGLELLLAATAELTRRSDLPAWRLQLTGPADVPRGGFGEAWRDALDARYRPALGERLEWSPPIFDAAALAGRYGATDVFCYPSVAERGETFGLAVAEAMAAQAAPVVSALPCFRDLVTDRRNGLVFNHTAPDAAQQLAGCLARLLQDAALRRRLAAQAQNDTRRFDFAEVARQLLADFAQLTASAP